MMIEHVSSPLRSAARGASVRSMRLVSSLMAVASFCACAGTLPLSQQRTMNRVLLATSTVSLVCDMGQTIPVAMQTPADQPFEGNWLMGTHPSVRTLIGYNAGVVAVNGAIYAALPERRRWLVPLLLTLVEAAVIINNGVNPHQRDVTRPWCGIR